MRLPHLLSLAGHGAKLKDCCSKTSLSDPRQPWTGTFRAIRHSEMLKVSAAEVVAAGVRVP